MGNVEIGRPVLLVKHCYGDSNAAV